MKGKKYLMVDEVLEKIAETTVLEKFDNATILNDTDGKFPDNIAFENKNSLLLLKSLIKPKRKILFFPEMRVTIKTFTRAVAIFFLISLINL